MIDVSSSPASPEPAGAVSDLAGLVDSFRRPQGEPHITGWLPNAPALPRWVEREVDAVVRSYLRPAGQTLFRFRRPGVSMIVCGGNPDDEAAVVDRVAKALDLRIFSFDLMDLRRLRPDELEPMLAPLYDGRSAIVHLGRIDKFDPVELESILARRSSAAFVIATCHSSELPAARLFRRKLVFAR